MNYKGDTLFSNKAHRWMSFPSGMDCSSMESMEIKPIPGQLELSTKDQQNLKGSIPIYKEGQTADKNSVQILDPVRTMHASSPLIGIKPMNAAPPRLSNTSSPYKVRTMHASSPRKGLFN